MSVGLQRFLLAYKIAKVNFNKHLFLQLLPGANMALFLQRQSHIFIANIIISLYC